MVNVQPNNAKLRNRAIRIIAECAAVDLTTAEKALDNAGSNVRTAIVALKQQ